MAVCNIFKKLTKETGTFLTFGQYADDLTEWHVKSNYHKISPSKFIAIDCPKLKYDNYTLPKAFQEYFENACAAFKDEPLWLPKYSKTIFWDTMFSKFINLESVKLEGDSELESNIKYSDSIKYVGDINLQSYNESEGIGYSELYCHIPNEACSYKYSIRIDQSNPSLILSRDKNNIIEGFNSGELNGWEKLTLNDDNEPYDYSIINEYEFSWENEVIGSEKLITTKLNDKSYNINMIVILYDILGENGQIIYNGIPMGIYITGLIDENGNILNSITKYVANEDIYNAGTSYGLRVCSRYSISPNSDNYIIKDITCEHNNYGDLNRVLSQISVSQNKMDEVINKTYNTEQNYKNLLAIFKNSRTNVPYIKIVNGESYWFVNGKPLGPSVVDGIYDSYSNEEVEDLIGTNRTQVFQVIAQAQNDKGKYIFEKGTSTDISLTWKIFYDGKEVSADPLVYLEITDVTDPNNTFIIDNSSNTNCLIFKQQDKTRKFQIKSIYNREGASTTVTVYFVDPIYFGEYFEDGGIKPGDYNWKPKAENIMNIKKYVTTSPQSTYQITTNEKNPGYICYAYPKTFNELMQIVDFDGNVYYNSQTNDNDFVMSECLINGVDYYVYINKVPVYVVSHIFKFDEKNSSIK